MLALVLILITLTAGKWCEPYLYGSVMESPMRQVNVSLPGMWIFECDHGGSVCIWEGEGEGVRDQG